MPRSSARRPGRRLLIAGSVALSLLVGPFAASSAVHADTPMTVTSVSPSGLGSTTVAPIHIVGTGMNTGDTIQATDRNHLTFSSITSDGNGGLNAIVTAKGASDLNNIEVVAPDQSTATCVHCLTVPAGPDAPKEHGDTPGQGELDLSWTPVDDATGYIVTLTPPGGPTQVYSVSGTPTAITGLANAVPYRVTIAAQTGDTVGDADEFTEEVGVVPDAPVLTGSSPCCDTDQVQASGQTWQSDGTTYTFTFTSRDFGSTTVYSGSSSNQSLQDGDPDGATVTATATNAVGTSAVSQPIIVKPIVPATAVRNEQYRYAHGKLLLTWHQPANDGNSPIQHYRVVVRHGGQRTVATTTTGRYQLPMPAGTHFVAKIQAVTTAGLGGTGDQANVGAAYLDVVTALDSHGRAEWRYDDRGGWHPLGGHLAAPPTPFVGRAGELTFVGANRHGRSVVRTRGRPWRSLGQRRCYQPTANKSVMGLTIACRATDGTLEYSLRTPLRSGLPYVPESDWVNTPLRIIGGPQIGGGFVIVRTRPWNTAGDDLRTYDLAGIGFGRLRMACTGPVSESQSRGGVVACVTGRRSIAWRSMSVGRHGTVVTPYRIKGPITATSSNHDWDDRLAFQSASGTIHVVGVLQDQLHVDQQWTLGHAAPSGLGGGCFEGCDP